LAARWNASHRTAADPGDERRVELFMTNLVREHALRLDARLNEHNLDNVEFKAREIQNSSGYPLAGLS
jgi:hypothetical protein